MPMQPPDHWHCDWQNTPTLPPATWLNGHADGVVQANGVAAPEIAAIAMAASPVSDPAHGKQMARLDRLRPSRRARKQRQRKRPHRKSSANWWHPTGRRATPPSRARSRIKTDLLTQTTKGGRYGRLFSLRYQRCNKSSEHRFDEFRQVLCGLLALVADDRNVFRQAFKIGMRCIETRQQAELFI